MQATSRRRFLLHSSQLITAALLCSCQPIRRIEHGAEPVSESVFTDATVDPNRLVLAPNLPIPEPPLESKIGQMIMVGFGGRYPDLHSNIVQDIATGVVGGVVLFSRNIQSPEQVQAMTATLHGISPLPLLIAVDQEGGWVNRLPRAFGISSNFSAQYLGTRNDLLLTAKQNASTAEQLATLGINLNLAPVVDVNTNPRNPIIGRYERSYSSDPLVVAEHAKTVIEAHRPYNILCTLKHFPGHGSSQADSHHGFVDVTAHWSVIELSPYAALIGAQASDVIMTAHIFNATLDEEHPATLSHATITGLLREKLGYDGVVISDDMQMGAIAKQYDLETAIGLAINAGVDIIAFSNNIRFRRGANGRRLHELILHLVETEVIPRARIEESYRRIMALKQKLFA